MANERARALRKIMRPQEIKRWVRLRELRSQGLQVRRRVPLGRFIVDFACLRSRLVVEVDGGQRGLAPGLAADACREPDVAALGYRVLRVWNPEVDGGLDDVVEAMYRLAAARKTLSGAPRHLPLTGEGLLRSVATCDGSTLPRLAPELWR